MTFISHIKSTVKSGVDQDLGKKTLIIGANGAGKSSIVNSVELACGGFASDIMGRSIVRKTSDLIMVSKNKKKLECTGTFDDGRSVSYRCNATMKGAGKAIHKCPVTVRFPFQEVVENLTGSSAKAREWLMDHLEFADPEEWDARILDAIAKTGLCGKENRSAAMAKIIATQKQVIKDAKVDIKASEKAKEVFSKNLTHPSWPEKPTASAVAALKQQGADLLAQIMASGSGRITASDVERARQKAISLVTELQGLEKQLLDAALVLDPSDVEAYKNYDQKLFDAMTYIYQYSIDHSMGVCSVCHQEFSGWSELHHWTKGQQEVFQKQTAKVQERLTLEEKYKQLEGLIPTAVEQFRTLEKTFKEQGGSNPNAALEYREINEKAEAGQRLLHHWEQIAACNTKIAEQKVLIHKSEVLLALSEQFSLDRLQNATEAFEHKVSGFLPEDYTFKLEISDTTCRIGMEKWGQVRFALSGAEWVQLVLAIAAATAKDDEFCIYIPEERAYDEDTLAATMKALSKVSGQVILTSTVHPPKAEMKHVLGWSMIELPHPLPF